MVWCGRWKSKESNSVSGRKKKNPNKMRLNWCHISIGFVLKFLNFLQCFVGLSILLYSIWMYNEWDHAVPPPPLPPPFDFYLNLNSITLPVPWFILDFMGLGILVLCISFLGCIAAEMVNGFCLCFYTILVAVLLLMEASLVGFIALDSDWEKDIPFDPTGQLELLRAFIEDNIDICTWVGISVLVIQALSLLVALIFRATVSTNREEYFDYEDGYAVRGRSREPLLSPQPGQPSGSSKGDNSGNHSDFWSSRMREKYGLNHGDKNSYQP